MPIVASLALALASFQAPASPIVLTRGGAGDAFFRYWAVEDTFLDSKNPDANYGRDALLTAGPGKTVLIRFGDLERMIPTGMKIVSARLVLRKEIGSDPKLRAAYQLLRSWGEGPGRRGLFARLEAKSEAVKTSGPAFAATWRHRHSGPSDAKSWQTAGATGERDARPIRDAKLVDSAEESSIEGLGEAFEWMRQHPDDNHGIALQFASEVDFASSDAPVGKPRLEITLEDRQASSGPDLEVVSIEPRGGYRPNNSDVTWVAQIRNVGNQPSSAFGFQWLDDDGTIRTGEVGRSLAPGESVEEAITLRMKRVLGDHRLDPLGFRIEPKNLDSSASNNALKVPRSGLPVQAPSPTPELDAEAVRRGYGSYAGFLQRAVRFWNETLLGHSRFSFCRDGSKERVRLVLTSSAETVGDPFDLRALLRKWSLDAGLRDLSAEEIGPGAQPILVDGNPLFRSSPGLYPGLMGGGDTRDDGEYLPQLPIPTEPWPDELVDQTPMPATDLYSATDVARLESLLDVEPGARATTSWAWPKTVLVRFVNAAGLALSSANIDVLTPESSGRFSQSFQIKTGGQGSATLPPPADPRAASAYLFRARLGATVEYGWLKASQILDAARRASSAATILDVRIPLPVLPIDPAQDLALNKIVADGADSLPARLVPLVDGDPSTAAEVAQGAKWIEIDLGRDRPIGEVQIQVEGGTVWQEFDIRIHQTGQRPSEALRYASVRQGSWMLANRSDPVPGVPNVRSLGCRGPGYKARYVRIVPLSSEGSVRIAGIRVVPFVTEQSQ